MKERMTIKHAVYTLEEKEKILQLYLSGAKTSKELAREYDLGNPKKIRMCRDTKLKQGRLIHSVSYKGSWVNNVPIESWFSDLKTESVY
jgi:transposase-like protein